MRVGASLLLIAIGAILKFAVTASIGGVDIGVVGVILMIVGVIGLIISIVLMTTRRRTDVVQQGSPYVDERSGRVVSPTSRTTYREPADPEAHL